MRALAVFPGRRELRIVDVPAPARRGEHDVLVRIREVGICGTDRDIAGFKYGAPAPGTDRLVLGHEAFGEVVEVGASVRTLAPGDLVALTVRRPSTDMYGGSHGAGRYADGLVPAAQPTTDPAYFEIEVARDAAPGAIAGELTAAGRTIPVALTIAPVTLPPLPIRAWAYEDPREIGWTGADERACIALFRRHDEERLDAQYAVRQDEARLIQSTREAADQLREVFETDIGPQAGFGERASKERAA